MKAVIRLEAGCMYSMSPRQARLKFCVRWATVSFMGSKTILRMDIGFYIGIIYYGPHCSPYMLRLNVAQILWA